MKQSDYEKLKNLGYAEDEIKIALDGLSVIGLNKQGTELGLNRDDRTVIVKDREGTEKKTSSIMMGYNKQGIHLENGDYVSYNDFSKALAEVMSEDKEDKIYICKKSGKKIEQTEFINSLLKEVLKNNTSLKLNIDNTLLNQNSAHISINDPIKNHEYNKGILMLGNKKMLLPNGEYILTSEIEKALQDYLILIPKKEEVSPTEIDSTSPNKSNLDLEKSPSKKENVYRVIKRVSKKMSMIPIIIATVATVLSGFKMIDTYTQQQTKSIVNSIVYKTDRIEEKSVEELTQEAIKKISSSKTGDKINVSDGVDYGESSDYKYGGANQTGTFGSDLRKEGKYTLDYISVLHNGKIVKVNYQKGESIDKIVNQVSNKLNIPTNKLEPMLHIGGPVSGWVSYDDLCKKIKDNSTTVKGQLEAKENYMGIINNFSGDYITLENGALIRIKDSNGNLLKDGSTVIGNDGEKYRIKSLDLKEQTITQNENTKSDRKLTWSINNISKEFALLAGALGIAATLLTKKEEKEMMEMTEEKIRKLVEEARKRFDKESEFAKAVNTLTEKRINLTPSERLEQSLIEQELPSTVEKIENLGGVKK